MLLSASQKKHAHVKKIKASQPLAATARFGRAVSRTPANTQRWYCSIRLADNAWTWFFIALVHRLRFTNLMFIQQLVSMNSILSFDGGVWTLLALHNGVTVVGCVDCRSVEYSETLVVGQATIVFLDFYQHEPWEWEAHIRAANLHLERWQLHNGGLPNGQPASQVPDPTLPPWICNIDPLNPQRQWSYFWRQNLQ
jgi:hypothetical protein